MYDATKSIVHDFFLSDGAISRDRDKKYSCFLNDNSIRTSKLVGQV
ncbi:hypothetical protein PEPS_03040 [Persicobacter psychrovividus]|uniref:Uncharacterized protein n=1 Tax=Persicobacter psychrovividus TaxID=387638 RepID=A0ABM7VAT7_9BACT|nr:hypothetical protein PEPS_03040 [Persicobacter psychrovividus]